LIVDINAVASEIESPNPLTTELNIQVSFDDTNSVSTFSQVPSILPNETYQVDSMPIPSDFDDQSLRIFNIFDRTFKIRTDINWFITKFSRARQVHKVMYMTTEGPIQKRVSGGRRIVFACMKAVNRGVWDKSICKLHVQYIKTETNVWVYDTIWDLEHCIHHSDLCSYALQITSECDVSKLDAILDKL
jgi:hypothetical protein